jgi:Purine catabolism regulatory protein-like family/PucR C-terminal helix-turn-helix domain/GGDEF-like domain
LPLTVAELLSHGELELTPLVRGELDRVIRWVHSSEMPDPSPYLRGDEVVLSAGIWFWAGSSPQVFAAGLAGAGAAAIGFGPSALVPEVPPPLVEACAKHGLTLFAIPDHVPFIAVIETFVEHYVEDRERELLDAQDRNEQLVRAAQDQQGIGGVLRVLARHRQGAAWVVERRRGLLAATGGEPPAELVAAVAASGRHPLPGWTVVPIVPTGIDAWLVLEGGLESLPAAARSAIEQAVAFLAIELQRDVAVRESERRFAAELVDLVAAGDAQLAAATARLEAFGLDPSAPLATIVCETDDTEDGLAALESLLSDLAVRSVAAVKGLQIVAMVGWSQPAAELRDLARRIRAALRDGSAVGVAGVTCNAGDLRRALIEAQQACQFATRGALGFAMYAEVGSHAALLALQDESVVAQFRDALLRPLVEHDLRRHTELVRTLELFLESGGAYQQTADELHVHVNTLRLRLARVEELTGRSLSDMETRVDLFIALRARR